jgi:arginine decarboxylase
MNNTYTSLVNQTFHFPQEGFDQTDDGYLEFNGLDLKKLIDKYGTPMKLTYLPKIGMQINKAKKMFEPHSRNINTKENIFIVIAPRVRISLLS